MFVVVRDAGCGLWRCCGEAGQGLAAPAAGSGRQAGGGAAGAGFLASVPCGGDALVAGDGQAGGEQQPGGQAHEAAPAAGDVAGGGVFEGGEAAFGAGAAGVGAAVRGGGVVVFLRGLGQGVRGDGEGLLGAAGGRVLRRGEDLGPVPVQGHGGRAERAADLAHDRGAHDAVVAVGVVAGDAAELVAGQLRGPGVVRRGLLAGGVAGQRPELGAGCGRAGAVQVAVGDDGAVVGAVRPAVGWVQVLDELGAGGAQRDRPVRGDAVGVAGVGEDVAERDPGGGQRGQDGDERGDRVLRHDERVMRRAYSGTGGPCSSGIMMPAEK